MVCRCLRITEADLLRAMGDAPIRTLKELRLHTGAGDGCTACHHLLVRYLEQSA
jgi:bacterioferritin-associated ferredoxin